jgi:hypothetical protein
MGRSETSTSSLGIKILLSDLLLQINEKNFNIIKEILEDGFIEDDNDMFNSVYNEIIYSIDNNKLRDNYLKYKEFLEEKFKNNGTYNQARFSNVQTHTLDSGSLFNKYLLFPIKDILSTSRWGYERYGTNGSSRPIDFNLLLDLDKYEDIEKYSIVFILRQSS